MNMKVDSGQGWDIVACLTHWSLGDLDVILKIQISFLFYLCVSSYLLMIMPSDECHKTLVLISQHWFRSWLGAVRQQAISWANVDPDLCRHMLSLGPNESSSRWQVTQHIRCWGWNIPRDKGQYHSCWCPGTSCLQVSSSHDIET